MQSSSQPPERPTDRIAKALCSLSLRQRLIATTLLVEVLMLAILVGNSVRLIHEHLLRQAEARIAANEVAFKPGAAAMMAVGDYASLRDLLDGWQEAGDIVYLAVTDRSGRIVANSGWEPAQPLPAPHLTHSGVAHIAFEIDYLGQAYGQLHYGLSMDFLAEARAQLFTQSVAIASIEVVASLLLLSLIAYLLTRRLDAMIAATDRIAAGEYDIRLPANGKDEVSRLAANFNGMAHAIALRIEELRFQARHDALTGLHNRRAFEEELTEALKRRGDEPLYVLYIDLDQFKTVNDSCGHTAGDLLLRQVTGLLMQERRHGFIARLGGDEFGLILQAIDEPTVRAHGTRIIDTIRHVSFVWEGRCFHIGASIGVARADAQHDTVTGLLIAADTACYAAKERGRGRVELYAPGDDWFQRRQAEFAILPRITQALDEGGFVLYHQRIRPLLAAGPDAAEVLVRMLDAQDQIIGPAHFIPAAERYNLMPYLDRWVIDAVCAQMAAWQRAGRAFPFAYLAINLSGTSLDDDELVPYIAGKLAEYGIDARRLCFEITESCAVSNPGRALEFIAAARQWGAILALDDFGSGLSSFGYLKQFRVDSLKIDGQFVRQALSDASDRAVLEAMVRLARAHDLRTTAEYVAEPALIALMRDLGIDCAQGYAIHEPSPLAEV